MDIMNNMTVSTSKLTFSLIAIAALLVSGSAFLDQDASATIPTFTAFHNSSTTTQIVFDQFVNGTIEKAAWHITATGARGEAVAVAVTGVMNTTHSPYLVTNELTFFNETKNLTLTHAAIAETDATLNVNFTKSVTAATKGHITFAGANTLNTPDHVLPSGADDQADDQQLPVVVSAEILKSNPKQVRILMSENMAIINSTYAGFTMTTENGARGGLTYELIPQSIQAFNGTVAVGDDPFIYVNLQNAAIFGDVSTIAYNTDDGDSTRGNHFITDATNSFAYATTTQAEQGIGNRLANFTAISVTNWLAINMYGDVTTCYDCAAPVVTDVKVSLDSSIPIKVTDDNQVHINAGIGDTVSVMVTVADNMGADTIPFAGLYTNFGDTPDNLYYANNFDSAKQMSTSYYEWNVRNDDIAFDNDGALTWTDATAKVNPDRTQTFTYTMTINDSIESSQVWVDIGDKAGNYAKVALPITLEVSGAPGLTFASDDTQKVVSFFNESILLAIVSQWTATSSDDASNVEQLSSVLGIESQLPTWTTDLASWVADDKIDVADMIVAVEYVINQ